MKEFSIEEKAQRYDEAIERAKKWSTAPNIDKMPTYGNRIIEEIFPELKESDDERISGNIIATIHLYYGEPLEDEAKEMIVWFEKQGEQKPAETEKGAKGNEREIPNSAWSEEDEENMIMIEDRLSDYLDYIREDTSLTKLNKNSMKEEIIEYVNWLKSLKERVQPKHEWKPSDEQIELLREVQQALLGKDCHNRFVNFMYELKRLREE